MAVKCYNYHLKKCAGFHYAQIEKRFSYNMNKRYHRWCASSPLDLVRVLGGGADRCPAPQDAASASSPGADRGRTEKSPAESRAPLRFFEVLRQMDQLDRWFMLSAPIKKKEATGSSCGFCVFYGMLDMASKETHAAAGSLVHAICHRGTAPERTFTSCRNRGCCPLSEGAQL